MITWYKDDEIGIYFDRTPDVSERFICPWDNEETIKNINKKPFINLQKLNVALEDLNKGVVYNFDIEKSYCWDGASIPRMFWRLVGSKEDNRYLIASLVHDVLCENHEYVENNRYFADKVFERLLYVAKVPAFSRWMMFHCVDNYQKFCGW